jgi:predicted nucleic acid-binding protein
MSRSSVPSPLVIDASAVVELTLRSATGERVAAAIGDAALVAPDLLNVEVANALRGLERGGKLPSARASKAVARLVAGNIGRVPSRLLLAEAWAMRENVSLYDACYLALARTLRCSLLTTDRRLASAPSLGVTIVRV